jgi:hypothetical protein
MNKSPKPMCACPARDELGDFLARLYQAHANQRL